jgi:putative ABC transport system permease protein
MTLGIKNDINEGKVAQAVLPIQEITSLSKTFVDPMQALLLVITSLICLISGVSILVSIYNSMNDRRHEIAVMRALGASRGCVLLIVLLESILLSLGGGFLGWVGGHALVGVALRSLIEDRTGVTIGFFDLAPSVNPLELLGMSPIISAGISPEFLLIPGLIVLAVAVGLMPALAAYRTDVARALSATP